MADVNGRYILNKIGRNPSISRRRLTRLVIAIVGLGLLWLLSGTNAFTLLAKNDMKTGAVSYMHIDAPVTVKSGQEVDIMIGLRDQTGQPLTDRTYGSGFGNFMIPPDGIKSAGGKTPVFNVASARTKEVLDASGQKTGLYRVPIIISSWPASEETGSYVVTARYFGGDYSTPDNSSHLSYSLTSSATFNAEVGGKPGFLRYADAEIDKAVLTVPPTNPNEALPPPKTNTVVFRVKMTAQEPTQTDGRQMHGWARPENIGKWAAPRAVDNAGLLMKTSYGEIKEEEIDVKGKKIPTGIYNVPVNLVTSGEVAGRSAVVTIGVKEENFVLEMSSTVNFTSTGPEVRALANPFFANQYLINPPHTPTIYELDYPSLVDPENWTNGAIGNLLSGVADNSLTNINVTAAEYWIDSGTHYPMTASDGAFNSPWEWVEATVTPTIMLPLTDARHLTYVRAQETGGAWGATASTYLHLDRTPATVATTRPPDATYGLYVRGSSYQVLGDTTNPASSGDTMASPIESVQVYEVAQLAWLDAINDVSRGGSNFSFWSYYSSDQWNSAAVPNGSYNLRARVVDTAGNVSGEFVVAVTVDNLEPTAALTVPAPGQGFNASPIAITGTASDANFSSWLLEYGTGASPSTWTTIVSGTTAVNNAVFTNWNVSTFSDGAYTVRLTVTDRAGNVSLITRVIYIDHVAPGSTISTPAANAWVNGATNITGVATDALSVDGDDVSIQRASNGYYWNGTIWQSGVVWLPATVTSGGGTPNANWSYAWPASGLNHNESVTVSSRARDSAGNLQNPPVSVTVKADTLAPTINWPASPVPQQWYTTNQTVTVTLNDGNPANGIGSRGFRWAWDTPPTDDPGTMNVSGDGPGNTVFPSEGKHILYIRAYDNLGNMRLESREYWYDATTPGGWTGQAPTAWVGTQTPTVTVRVTDITSGLDISAGSPQYSFSTNAGTLWSAWQPATVDGVQGSTAPQTITAVNVPFNQDSGTQNMIKFRIRDVAGNGQGTGQESPGYTIKTDATPPTSSVTALGTYFNGPVTWSGSDAGSGVQSYDIQSSLNNSTWTDWILATPLTNGTFSGVNGTTYYFRSRAGDAVGNLEAYPATGDTSSIYDNTQPTASAVLSGTAGTNGWYVSNVQVTLNAADVIIPGTPARYYRLDGGAWTTYSAPFTVSGNAQHTVQYYAVDAAGNQSVTYTQPVNIDTSLPPIPTMNAEPPYTGGTENTVAWGAVADITGNVKYYVECSLYADFNTIFANSGWISATFFKFTGLDSNDIAYYYRVRSRDDAGNENTWSTSVTSIQTAGRPAIVWGGATPQVWYTTTQNVTAYVTSFPSAPTGFRYAWDAAPTDDPLNMMILGGNTGTFPFVGEGQRSFFVRAYNDAGYMTLESREYWYDPTPPDTWTAFTQTLNTLTPTCTVTVSDLTSGLNVTAGSAQYSYSENGGTNWSAWTDTGISGTQGIKTPQVITATAVPFTLPSETQNLIRFRVMDIAGNTGTSANYIVDNLRPAVTTTDPVNDGTFVPTSQCLKAFFNMRMNAASLTTSTFTLNDGAGNVAGTVRYYEVGASYYATFAPAVPLARNKIYTATVTTAVQDTKGHNMAANYVWTFTTAGIVGNIVTPVDNGRLTGAAVNIIGAATGETSSPAQPFDFKEYSLWYGTGTSPATWNPLGVNPRTNKVENGTLGTWNTTTVADGVYTLKLTVTDNSVIPRSFSYTKPVLVDNTAPPAPTINALPAYVSGVVSVTGTATDATSGPQKVELQFDGAGPWLAAVGTNRTEETGGAIAYGGVWTAASDAQASGGGDKYSTATGATATFSFNAASVSWFAAKGPDRGYANVYIDNVLQQQVDLFNFGTTLWQVPVYMKTGLTLGPHTLKVEAVGDRHPVSTGNRVDIDAFDVNGQISWSYSWDTVTVPDGSHTITARVTDRVGLVGPSTSPPASTSTDNSTPSAIITSPTANLMQNAGTIAIIGTANDPIFQKYELFYGAGPAPTTWTAIGVNPRTVPVINGLLGAWDVSLIPDGAYMIKLVTTDMSNHQSTATVYPILIDRTIPYSEITAPANMDFVNPTFTVSGIAFDYLVNSGMSDISDRVSPDKNQVHVVITKNVDSYMKNPVDMGAVDTLVWSAPNNYWLWTKQITRPAGEDWGWFAVNSKAYDRAGNVETSTTGVYLSIDDVPPPQPTLRGLPDHTVGAVSLSWIAPKDTGSGIDYFNIYKQTGGGGPYTLVTSGLKYYDGTLMEAVDTTGKFYSANALDVSFSAGSTVTFSYYVTVTDFKGLVSTPSNTITVKYDSQAPTAPTNLIVSTAGNNNDLTLKWSPASDNLGVAEYKLYRSTDVTKDGLGNPIALVNQTQVATIPTSGAFATTRFFDKGLNSHTTYYYQVVAYDEQMNLSPASAISFATTGEPGAFSLPHVTFDSATAECALCHRTHTAVGETLLAVKSASDVCMSCHDGTGSSAATKQEFDYAPSGGHRVKDDQWPNGKLNCVDCHDPHRNPDHAFMEDFEPDPPATVPVSWTVGSGVWGIEGDSQHHEMGQTATSGSTYLNRNTGLNVAGLGGLFAAKLYIRSGTAAYFTVGSDGAGAKRGPTVVVDPSNSLVQLCDGGTVLSSRSLALSYNTWYRVKLKIGADKIAGVTLTQWISDTNEPSLISFITSLPPGTIKGTGSYIQLGTVDASALFDKVRLNNVGMLTTRYRSYYVAGNELQNYKIPDDLTASEEFCLACHGSAIDSPGGSHRQFYTSAHNPLVGSTSTNPSQAVTPRWQTLRAKWQQIRSGPMGANLKGTNNACLYCHGYHGQQSYMRIVTGEEDLCFKCHGKEANYSRTGKNVYNQYQQPYHHGITLREAAVKCTSCHGQRGISDRFVWEGFPTSNIVNPRNIKQPWVTNRIGNCTAKGCHDTAGWTQPPGPVHQHNIDDYCNVCHSVNRLPVETHSTTVLVPYTIKYPPIYTTSSANGFVRGGYSAKDAAGNYLVGHKKWTSAISCASGTCHEGLVAQYPGVDISQVPEFNFKITCTTCHHQHASDNARVVRMDEDFKGDMVVAAAGSKLKIGTVLKAGSTALSATDKNAIGGTWNGTTKFILVSDVTVPGDVNLAGQVRVDFGSTLTTGSILATGSTATSAADRFAIGGSWAATAPYALLASRTLAASFTLVNNGVVKGMCMHCHDGSVTK